MALIKKKPPYKHIACMMVAFGASEKTRTFDLLITNQLHYRLCYTSKIDFYILSLLFNFVKG